MKGTWAVQFEERPGGGLTASLAGGPVSAESFSAGDRVELVPCDHAAVDRVARFLHVQFGLFGEECWDTAEAILKLAGETDR